MEKNKTGKYFKYAIGEIILVVIGILIALSINNWNENRKDSSKSRDYIIEFKNDLAADTIRMSRGIALLDTRIEAEKWALHKTEYEFSDIDSIILALGEDYYDLKINDRTFNSIQNSGNSKLTGYGSIFKKLSHYYIRTNKRMTSYTKWDEKEVTDGQEYMKDLKQTIEINNDYIRGSIGILDESQFPMITDVDEQAKLIISFATSVQGRNHFKDNYIRHVGVKEVFNVVLEEAKLIINLIDEELEQ